MNCSARRMDKKLLKKSLRRWQKCKPDENLTWGLMVKGGAFIDITQKHFDFSNDKNILELGPGYGRILESILYRKLPFNHYTGIDISKRNVIALRKKFNSEKISFVVGNINQISLNGKYDLVLASLIVHHQYPSMYEPLKNIVKYMKDGAVMIFDCPENRKPKEKRDLKTLLEKGPEKGIWDWRGASPDIFIWHYTKDEIVPILNKTQLKLVSFDNILHDKRHVEKLVTVAKKI